MLNCKFCNRESKNLNSLSNHQRLCPSNPERVYVSQTLGRTAWNKGLTSSTDLRVSKMAESISKSSLENPRYLTAEQKSHLSVLAKERGLGGYKPNAGRSKKFKVLDSYGDEVCLQSTYELKCSELLNQLGINWVRPRALKYDGKNYFADFYLPDFDVYLDPKNNYKAKLDKTKIERVIEQNNVRVFILLENQLTHEFIKSLCS